MGPGATGDPDRRSPIAGATDPRQSEPMAAGLPESDRHRVLVQWNATGADFSGPSGAHELFEAQVERSPDAVAVAFEGRSLTYRELNRRADALARRLRARGVGPDVFVGICMARSEEIVVGALAILKAGGAYVPLDPTYPVDRLTYMIGDAGLSVLVTDDAAFARTLSPRLPSIEPFKGDEEGHAEAAGSLTGVGPENIAFVIYTSGSTGRPKGVQIPHRALVNLLHSLREQPGLQPGDTLLALTSLSFDLCVMDIFFPLSVGARVLIASSQAATSGAELRELLETREPTMMQATPATWRLLLEAGWKGSSRLKIISGGEALPRGVANQLLARSGAFWNMYGPTETTIYSTLRPVEPGPETVPVGRPIANTQIYILDERKQPVPVGVMGEIFIGGAGLARGYIDRPALTAEKFIPDPWSGVPGARLYASGDLGRYLPNGEIECLGRIDHQVKVRGFRIELGEVEEALYRIPGVQEAAVVARGEGESEKALVAYVVRRPGAAPSAGELRSGLKKRLPDFMIPTAFVMLETLPRTPNGKVDRRALPAPEEVRAGREREIVVPRDPWELGLARIWEEVLGTRPLGVRDNFFELGGHSLIAGRMFSRIEKQLGKNVAPTVLLRAPTIEELARELRGEETVSPWSALVPIQPLGSRPPLFCIHAGAGTILFYYDLAQKLGSDQPVYGLQARGLYGDLPPQTRLDEMAELYIREMRMVQPSGPYFLAGFCLGAILAFEMAHQLLAAGETIAFLGSFDGPRPAYDDVAPVGDGCARPASWMTRHSAALSGLGVKGKAAYLARKIQARWKYSVVHLRYANRLMRYRVGECYRRLGLGLPARLRRNYFLVNHYRAERLYQPHTYPGKMTIFETKGIFRDRGLGWDCFVAGELEIYEIPGDHRYHRDLMSGAFIEEVTGWLQTCLERASRTSTAA